ncbi:MAG: glycosyl hydrolase 53 family protein, partial [Candidatus Brocadiae bacterium]|nr:glycosyl hydrolase 53 family protein [Candidatus Brocadiia bacterium]
MMANARAEAAAVLLLVGAVAAAGAARREEAKRVFLKGGDISMLTRIEGVGGVYREEGEKREALAIFRGKGWNCVRLRLFHSPSGEGAVCNDLEYTVKLARRAKRAGFQILLDFHYSDTWADPGHQRKPAAWEGLAFEELERAVFAYTRDCIAAFRKAEALPDVVQLGNEITPGMLWPEGRVGGKEFNTPKQWARLAALLAAGRRGVK